MASKENLTALKTLVISMGFLLVGGTVLLAGIVWKKVAAETSSSGFSSSCPGGEVDLTGKGRLAMSGIDNGKMYLVSGQSSDNTMFYTIDMCSGKVISALTLKTGRADDAANKQ